MPTPLQMYQVLDSLVASGSLTIDSLFDYAIYYEAAHIDPGVDLREHLHATLERNMMAAAGKETHGLLLWMQCPKEEKDEVEGEILKLIDGLKKKPPELKPDLEAELTLPTLEEFRQRLEKDPLNDKGMAREDTDDERTFFELGPMTFEIVSYLVSATDARYYSVNVGLYDTEGDCTGRLDIIYGLEEFEDAVAHAYQSMIRLLTARNLLGVAQEIRFFDKDLALELEDLVASLKKTPAKPALERILEDP